MSENRKNFLKGIAIGLMAVSLFCGVVGFIKASELEYRIKIAERTADEAKKEVVEMRERLLLPAVAPVEVVRGQK